MKTYIIYNTHTEKTRQVIKQDAEGTILVDATEKVIATIETFNDAEA